MPFFKISAVTGKGIKELIRAVAAEVLVPLEEPAAVEPELPETPVQREVPELPSRAELYAGDADDE